MTVKPRRHISPHYYKSQKCTIFLLLSLMSII